MMKPNELGEQVSGTTVGANVVLSGTLKDVNDIIIFGRVEGEVISDKNVFIGDSAFIKGPVTAQTITVSGKIKGAIAAHERLELTPTGKVYGSIVTKDLIIQSGAVFVGKSEMTNTGDDEETKTTSHKKSSEVEVEAETKQTEEKNSETDSKYEVEA